MFQKDLKGGSARINHEIWGYRVFKQYRVFEQAFLLSNIIKESRKFDQIRKLLRGEQRRVRT